MKVLMKNYIHYTIMIMVLLLPSCGRMIDWGKKTFVQTPTLQASITAAQKYIRSVTSYDQLTTRARFDALWLSDDVRINYANLFAVKFGKTEEQRKTFLRRQLEENNHFISFYVLSLYDQPLGDANSEWTLFLNIDDKHYAPIEIKSVELSPEYMYIFGKKYNRFKVPYSVKFDAKDINDQFLITPQTKNITLYCRSLSAEVTFVWNIVQ
ncbi:MAG TPA: hypothetical protein VKR54_03250 [Candidatus Babeliales bacterium]|jgi:hypothetical protein|nr:hypothetical protein [Candidatus Babeliales bacterium]